jgi:hypothetical protein
MLACDLPVRMQRIALASESADEKTDGLDGFVPFFGAAGVSEKLVGIAAGIPRISASPHSDRVKSAGANLAQHV